MHRVMAEKKYHEIVDGERLRGQIIIIGWYTYQHVSPIIYMEKWSTTHVTSPFFFVSPFLH